MNELPARAEVAVRAGARTPEELEVLFEDTLVLRDPHTLAALFEDGAVLVAGTPYATTLRGTGEQSARGGEAIARLALALWAGPHSYIAAPQQVLQARDLALIVGERGVNVARRGSDGVWRYAIVRQSIGE